MAGRGLALTGNRWKTIARECVGGGKREKLELGDAKGTVL